MGVEKNIRTEEGEHSWGQTVREKDCAEEPVEQLSKNNDGKFSKKKQWRILEGLEQERYKIEEDVSEEDESEEDESEEEGVDEEPKLIRLVDEANITFVLEELDNDPGYDSNVEVLRPDQFEDPKSDENGTKLEENDLMNKFKDLQCKENSSDEEEQQRSYRRKKKRWSVGIFKRSHSQSVEGDYNYLDNGSYEDVDAILVKARMPEEIGTPTQMHGFKEIPRFKHRRITEEIPGDSGERYGSDAEGMIRNSNRRRRHENAKIRNHLELGEIPKVSSDTRTQTHSESPKIAEAVGVSHPRAEKKALKEYTLEASGQDTSNNDSTANYSSSPTTPSRISIDVFNEIPAQMDDPAEEIDSSQNATQLLQDEHYTRTGRTIKEMKKEENLSVRCECGERFPSAEQLRQHRIQYTSLSHEVQVSESASAQNTEAHLQGVVSTNGLSFVSYPSKLSASDSPLYEAARKDSISGRLKSNGRSSIRSSVHNLGADNSQVDIVGVVGEADDPTLSTARRFDGDEHATTQRGPVGPTKADEESGPSGRASGSKRHPLFILGDENDQTSGQDMATTTILQTDQDPPSNLSSSIINPTSPNGPDGGILRRVGHIDFPSNEVIAPHSTKPMSVTAEGILDFEHDPIMWDLTESIRHGDSTSDLASMITQEQMLLQQTQMLQQQRAQQVQQQDQIANLSPQRMSHNMQNPGGLSALASSFDPVVDPVLETSTGGTNYEERWWQRKNDQGSHVESTNANEPEDDNMSVISSYAASIFSVQSLASSATDLSKGSGYSVHQIATATKELVAIFQEDGVLVPLYKSAIENPSIGPERLQRNLRRLFKQYAGHLEGEATDRLEYLAARLVSLKARFLAQSILQRFDSVKTRTVNVQEIKEESSEDEEEAQTVDETEFDDMGILRVFLINSEAFQTLRAQVQSFVLPKGPQTSINEATTDKKRTGNDDCSAQEACTARRSTTHAWVDRLWQAWNTVLIATGQLEPPLEPNKVRLRWQCACGENFMGDVIEYKQGGIAKLVTYIERSTGSKVVATPYSAESSNQKAKYQHLGLSLQKALTTLMAPFRKPTEQCTLPQHNSNSATACPTSNANPPQQQMLHLLACMHAGQFRKVLTQERIESITTDRKLFYFMRQQFTRSRGRFSTLLSLKKVQGIFFIKFRLPIGGSVEVRHHNPCCGPECCECIPPADRVEPSPQAEYRCIPGPPTVWPPIDPHYLSHLFTSPSCINENDTWVLDQLPKRVCGELQGKAGKPAEGWGVYYQEGWDRDTITWATFLIFLAGSIVFGVVWSKFEMDIQGAFGVSAYMIAACGVFISLVSMKVDQA